MAALILKRIERSSVTFTTTDETKTVTLTNTLTDTTKTILLFTASSASGAPEDYDILGRVLSTTQIQFERTVGPTTDCIVEYQVIEFVQGITVQHKYFTQTAATTDTAISTVTLSKAFPILSMNQSGTTFGANDIMTADITTTTNLQTFSGSYTSCPVAVQIVEIDDATVQRISGTYGTGTTADVGISTIVESDTFWLFTMSTTSSFFFENIPYLSFVNTTTLRFTRYDTTGINFNYIVYVVSIANGGITVQNIATTITSGNTSVSPSISNVVVNNTALLLNGLHQRLGAVNDTSGDDAGENSINLYNLASTSFTAYRAEAPALDTTTNVQVLSFRSEVDQVVTISDFF